MRNKERPSDFKKIEQEFAKLNHRRIMLQMDNRKHKQVEKIEKNNYLIRK